MNERINDKIEEIEKYLDNLSSYIPNNFDDYVNDIKTKDACEHCFEKIIEALADLAFLVINQEGWTAPKDDIDAFFVLSDKNMIPKNLAQKMKEAKTMRNFIAHQYGKVDDEMVFNSINGELVKDTEELLSAVKKKFS